MINISKYNPINYDFENDFNPVVLTEIRRGILAITGTTTTGTLGGISPTLTGSVVAVSFGGTTPYPKLRLLTTVGATNSTVGCILGSLCQVNQLSWGFRFLGAYIYSDQSSGGTNWYVPNARQFCGLTNATTLLGISSTVTVESQINVIGIGSDSADTNLQIFHNDGTGSCTKIDLGSNFPANKTGAVANGEVYALELLNNYKENFVYYKVTKLSTGEYTNGIITTNLPANNIPLMPQVVRTSGATSQNVSIDILQIMSTTKY